METMFMIKNINWIQSTEKYVILNLGKYDL